MRAIEKAIIKTLAYADIFEYPLKKEEIWKYLITKNKPDGLRQFDNSLEQLTSGKNKPDGLKNSKPVGLRQSGYYFFAGREKIVELRKRREKWSREKIKKAKKVVGLLKILPTVKLVGISGALAMENCDENDDIDLFIITSSGRLWLTRLLVTVLVELTGQRRRPRQGKLGNWRGFPYNREAISSFAYKDRICLNMFVDEDHLAIPPKERNLFTSHEVVQMRKIWDREGIYERFLGANSWVREYLPNALPVILIRRLAEKNLQKYLRSFAPQSGTQDNRVGQIGKFMNWLEEVSRVLQLKYMSKRRTTEKISPGRILFHPEDKSRWVMGEYERRFKMKNLKLKS